VSSALPPLRLDGPYGHLSLTPDDYSRLLLLGGGVGITPLTSTLRWLQDEVGWVGCGL
jgi:ferredoxin-NADP reductase